MILRFVFSKVSFLKILQPSGAGSTLLAFLVAYASVQKFDIGNIFLKIKIFQGLDSEMISYLTMAILWIGSSIWHKVLPADVGKSQAIKP